MIWGKRHFIGWCENCNVPLLDKRCDICHVKGKAIYMRNKGEIRPLFQQELDYINSIMEKTYGVTQVLPPTSFVNDSLDRREYGEVMVDGKNLCSLSFVNNRWRVKPYLDLANHLLNRDLQKKYVEIEPCMGLHVLNLRSVLLNKIVRHSRNIREGDYVIVKAGEVIAVGRCPVNLDNDKKPQSTIRILESMPLGQTELKGTSLKKSIRANKGALKSLKIEAIKAIRNETTKSNKKVMCSFSGGKDSAVILDLCINSLGKKRFDTTFVDTRNEFHETHKYIKEMEKFYDININIIEPKHDIFDLWKSFGPPQYSYRWCCKTQKFAPLNNFISATYSEGVLSIVGTRKNESLRRALGTKQTSKNTWIKEQTMFLPIHAWSELEVWLYLLQNDIPVNKVYMKGIRRCGCWSCPATHSATFKIMQKSHPKLISKLKRNLNKFSEKKESDAMIVINKWKNNNQNNGTGQRIAQLTPCKDGTKYYTFKARPRVVAEFMKVFGMIKKKGPVIRIEGILDASIIGSKLIIKGFNEEDLRRVRMNKHELLAYVEKQIHKSENCVRCALCPPQCPSGAISLNPRFKIDAKKCTHCLNCLKETCSVVSYHEKENQVLK
ncbi:phosphoadenosine phosphosulfate reductase family protein [Nanoarchaeota archaeon]